MFAEESEPITDSLMAENYQWRTQISEVLGMTTYSEQGYTATLDEAVERIKEIIEARDMFRAEVERQAQQLGRFTGPLHKWEPRIRQPESANAKDDDD